MKEIHLICNAHIDPVWQWEWEEGAAAAVSTFRVAANFCRDYAGFVFNHNEVILYQWIEEYEPELFRQIQQLVAEGKWHIIGGWYLQPDCNMSSGESLVRQILYGKKYFRAKFGAAPTTAVNFDSFGHSRGLVQILKRSGYDSYLFFRPEPKDLNLPSADFRWVGFDGSAVMAHRIGNSYHSLLGKAAQKVTKWLQENAPHPLGLVAWGVGNHGGGPSRIDLESLNQLAAQNQDYRISHSTPEAFFEALRGSRLPLKDFAGSLTPCNVGCYTSQIRIKQKHRLLENELYSLEKMLSSAAAQGYLEYPGQALGEAFADLLTAEFHDILPGSSIQPVEEMAFRLMDHGLEIASRLKARAFFALAAGQEKAAEGEIPILIYNPHPFKVSGIFECEFMLADQNWNDEFSLPVVYRQGGAIPSQPEKELSNLNLDWRKRVVFQAELQPSQMNRFDCRIAVVPRKPGPELKAIHNKIHFKTAEMEVVINCSTGLMDEYRVNGVAYLKPEAFKPLVMDDNDDPWGMTVPGFRDVAGVFQLMPPAAGTEFSGVRDGVLESVRVIEDGPVRSVIETVFAYHHSFICLIYKLPKQGTEIQLQVRVNWNEKSKMLKLAIPTVFEESELLGQSAYGAERLKNNGDEVVAQKWLAVVAETEKLAFTCINDGTYGADMKDGELRLSLLRSAGYSGHPILDRPIMPQDRFSPRIDQGERIYHFWLNGGAQPERLARIDRESLVWGEKPFVLSFFPSGAGQKPQPLMVLEDEAVQLTAFKRAENSGAYIIRLFEPTGAARKTTIAIPFLEMRQEVRFGAFEIKTLRLDVTGRTLTEVNLMEE